MPKFTRLNLEQSVARYLADHFLAQGYAIYWRDVHQTEGAGPRTLTFIRKEFPQDPTQLVRQSEPAQDHLLRVPAFRVVALEPVTDDKSRLGIGESIFTWTADLSVYGLADDELEWYRISAWFHDWLANPDVRIPLRDYLPDLTNPVPPLVEGDIQLQHVELLSNHNTDPTIPEAARYNIAFAAQALFTE